MVGLVGAAFQIWGALGRFVRLVDGSYAAPLPAALERRNIYHQ
jgi:hypothetical protein